MSLTKVFPANTATSSMISCLIFPPADDCFTRRKFKLTITLAIEEKSKQIYERIFRNPTCPISCLISNMQMMINGTCLNRTLNQNDPRKSAGFIVETDKTIELTEYFDLLNITEPSDTYSDLLYVRLITCNISFDDFDFLTFPKYVKQPEFELQFSEKSSTLPEEVKYPVTYCIPYTFPDLCMCDLRLNQKPSFAYVYLTKYKQKAHIKKLIMNFGFNRYDVMNDLEVEVQDEVIKINFDNLPENARCISLIAETDFNKEGAEMHCIIYDEHIFTLHKNQVSSELNSEKSDSDTSDSDDHLEKTDSDE